jgi:N-acetylmuramic acid 6-phosphate etherase
MFLITAHLAGDGKVKRMIQLNRIDTEQVNPRTANIDREDTLGILKLINQEDQLVAHAVEKELEHIGLAVDAIYEKMSNGGRLIYCGAGTSGRLGVLDAVECPPTFGVSGDMVVGLIAGGEKAFVRAVEGAEDNENQGRIDLQDIGFSNADVMVGIAASGRTPYVLGAMKYARELCAPVIGLTSSKGSKMVQYADIMIEPITGPEVITGSTRMKSGTAQKMVLNMLSTAVMIKLGKVYGNLMVDVKATNEKLNERAVSIVCAATGADAETARQALVQCGFSAKLAIVMLLCDIGIIEARKALDLADGHIARAVRQCMTTLDKEA